MSAPDAPSGDGPSPARARLQRLLALNWPLAAALVCWAGAAVLRRRWAAGGAVAMDQPRQWDDAAAVCVGVWLWVRFAAFVLGRWDVRGGRRLLLANAAPAALYAALSLACTGANSLGAERPGLLAFELPAAALHAVVGGVADRFGVAVGGGERDTPACAVSFWQLRARGVSRTVERAVELSDGSVLLVASTGALGYRVQHKLGRLTADGRPDTAFGRDRACMPDVDGVFAGPGGTFAMWGDPGALVRADARGRGGRVEIGVRWDDASGRPRTGSPFPAPPTAVPPWSEQALGRPTPTGFVLASTFHRQADAEARGDFNAAYVRLGVVRVLADGRFDPAFAPWPPAGVCRAGETACERETGWMVGAVQAWPDGALAVVAEGDSTQGHRHQLVRLLPDGRPDAAYSARATAALAPLGDADAVAVDAAGRALVALSPPERRDADSAAVPAPNSTGRRGAPRPRGPGLVRLRVDGTLDPAFRADSVEPGWRQVIAPQPDGHVVLGGMTNRPVRVDSTGRYDAAFGAALARLGARVLLVRRDGTVVAAADDDVLLLAPDGRELRRVASPALASPAPKSRP